MSPTRSSSRVRSTARGSRVRSSTARAVVQQNAHLTVGHARQRLDPLPRDLGVRLRFAKPLARRVQRNGRITRERLQIGEPPLRVREPLRHHDEEAPRESACERSHDDGGRRAGETANWSAGRADPGAWRSGE